MTQYLIGFFLTIASFLVALVASVIAFVLFYALHLWLSHREDDRVAREEE